jgi:hypothetical protein
MSNIVTDNDVVESNPSISLKHDPSSILSNPSKVKLDPKAFLDARFYTDHHFLKMASEMKTKYNKLNNINNTNTINDISSFKKPINIVVPLHEIKTSNLIKKKSFLSSNFLIQVQFNSEKMKNIDENDSTAVENVTSSSDNETLSKSLKDKYESRIDYLENQLIGMNEQLECQTQVNAELKTLLVASIGDDNMQYKIERLVKDKQRYEIELKSNNGIVQSLNEDIEQLSIQCDLWRSKFLASKLLIDEISSWKTFLFLLNKEVQKSLQHLLTETQLINKKLNLYSSLKAASSSSHHQIFKPKILNNLQIVDSLLLSQLKGLNNASDLNGGNEFSPTVNEILGQQFLNEFKWIENVASLNILDDLTTRFTDKNDNKDESPEMECIHSLDKLQDLIDQIKFKRSKLYDRLFNYNSSEQNQNNLILSCLCKNCKGPIRIV